MLQFSQNPSVTLLPKTSPTSQLFCSHFYRQKSHQNAETKAPYSHRQLCFSQQRNRVSRAIRLYNRQYNMCTIQNLIFQAKHRRSGVEATKAVLCLLRHNDHNNINTDGVKPPLKWLIYKWVVLGSSIRFILDTCQRHHKQSVPVEKFQFSGFFSPIWSELVHFDGNIELNLVYVEKQITNIIFDQVCYHVANI